MKKIVILGSKSMAGHLFTDYFISKDSYEVTCVNEEEIFQWDLKKVKRAVIFKDADLIINTIRCLVEESELNPDKAIIYNSYFPQLLSKLYKNKKTKIIHLSTDCVFLGDKGDYHENSVHNGQSIYSKTKSLGEFYNNKDIIIRSSYIGPTIDHDSEELFDWFLEQKGQVVGYDNVYWNGITTLELVKNIKILVNLNFSGVYHLTGSKKISKFTLLNIINKIWKKDKIINRCDKVKIDRSLVDTNKLIEPINYNSMFNELFDYMVNKDSIYKKYNLGN